MISIIHPTRGRPEKSVANIDVWDSATDGRYPVEFIISVDTNDPELPQYTKLYGKRGMAVLENDNRSCVDAINNAAKIAQGDIFIVVSDDTETLPLWNASLTEELKGKSDYLLKCKDGIQDYIVTMTVMDRKYYERDGYIYHPSYEHLFADTEQTCVADMRGRLIKSKLKFPHLHYSNSGGKELPDELNKRNDATWKQGQDNFIERYKRNFDLKDFPGRITDPVMNNWLKRMVR